MRQRNKLFLLLALLLTAATGAWATDTYTVQFKANGNTKTVENVTLPHKFSCNYSAVNGELDLIIKQLYGLSGGCCGIADPSSSSENVTCGLDGDSQFITISAPFEGTATVTGFYFNEEYTDFEYSLEISIPGYTAPAAPTTYTVSLADGVKDADKWTITPNEGLKEGQTVTLTYSGRLKVKGVKATSDAAPAAGKTVDLSTLADDYEAQNGDVLTGATTSYKVTIAAGATVTLDGVNISSGDYCIKCLGDATIILKDGSTNTLTSTTDVYPALSIGDANTTLTIQGSTGVLNVTSGVYCAGIGGGYMNTNNTCGNIRIEGGVITAQGGGGGAGIGTDSGPATCGDIIITGGTITAKGGSDAAGIGTGSGDGSSVACGDITIANTVTKVTATKGANAPYSIGKGNGDNATCGTVTIGGNVGAISESPYTYDPSAPAPAASLIVNPVVGQIIGSDGMNYDANATLPTGVTAVAKICYVGSDNGEDAPYNHGLALALSDANGGNTCTWMTSPADAGHTYKPSTSSFTTESGLQYNATHNTDAYPAFKAAIANNGTSAPTGCSAWFLASGYQWTKMATAAGGYNQLGLNLNLSIYWSSTEVNANQAWSFDPSDGYWGKDQKDYDDRVRSCLAF